MFWWFRSRSLLVGPKFGANHFAGASSALQVLRWGRHGRPRETAGRRRCLFPASFMEAQFRLFIRLFTTNHGPAGQPIYLHVHLQLHACHLPLELRLLSREPQPRNNPEAWTCQLNWLLAYDLLFLVNLNVRCKIDVLPRTGFFRHGARFGPVNFCFMSCCMVWIHFAPKKPNALHKFAASSCKR